MLPPRATEPVYYSWFYLARCGGHVFPAGENDRSDNSAGRFPSSPLPVRCTRPASANDSRHSGRFDYAPRRRDSRHGRRGGGRAGPRGSVASSARSWMQRGDNRVDHVTDVLGLVTGKRNGDAHWRRDRRPGRPADHPAHARAGAIYPVDSRARHYVRHWAGRNGQDLSGGGGGRRGAEASSDSQDRAGPAGGRGGRKPGFFARRSARQDQSVSAAAARRAA